MKPARSHRLLPPVCRSIALLCLTWSTLPRTKAEPPAGLTNDDWQALLQRVPPAQSAYAKASNTGADDRFGYAVAISGDTAVVGAYLEDSSATGVNGNAADNSAADSGAAYVFVYREGLWTQQAYLKASHTGAGDSFGYSVAIDGDTVVIGATGEDSSAGGVNGDEVDDSAAGAGAAYVFVRHGDSWSQQAYLKASNAGAEDEFGASLAIHGDTIVVGAESEDSAATGVNGAADDNTAEAAGAAYVFVRSGTDWSQEAYLKPSNTAAGGAFGYAVAISGRTLVVGAVGDGSASTGVNGDTSGAGAPESGAAYVFVRSQSGWTQQAYLKASNTGPEDWFGSAVAISGDTVIVGATYESSAATGVDGDQINDNATDSGAAYVFVRSGTTWAQQAYLKASNAGANDWFGWQVALDGDIAVISADGEDSAATGMNGDQNSNAAAESGAAYVFVRKESTWSQQDYLKASNAGADDRFGAALALSGGTVIAGAPREDSNATGIAGIQTNNSAGNSGGAYIFNGVTPSPESASRIVLLTWPVSEHRAVVHASDTLSEAWIPQTRPVVTTGSNSHMALAVENDARFFRLHGGFGVPARIDAIANPGTRERGPTLSSDGLSLIYCSDATGNMELRMTTRASLTSPWEPPVSLRTINSSGDESHPSLSADGLSLFFTDSWTIASTRPGNYGGGDLWVSLRASVNDPWQPPVNLGPLVNSAANESTPNISGDGRTLVFSSANRPGNGDWDMWMTTRSDPADATGWSAPENLSTPLNSRYTDWLPQLSRDGLALYFSSTRPAPGVPGSGNNLWVARRNAVTEPFGAPQCLAAHFPGLENIVDSCLSADAATLFFFATSSSADPASRDIWEMPVLTPPPPPLSIAVIQSR